MKWKTPPEEEAPHSKVLAIIIAGGQLTTGIYCKNVPAPYWKSDGRRLTPDRIKAWLEFPKFHEKAAMREDLQVSTAKDLNAN